ncbi:endonuclease VIII [Thiolapillus sp.]
MPEGPEIRRARDRLAAAIEGRTVQRVDLLLPALKSWNGKFDGCKVESIRSRGKAMLTRFSNGLSIYSHNQLYGRWLVTDAGQLPHTRRQLRLAIHCEHHSALLYSASDIEVWPTEQLDQHPFLQKLGPDVLEPSTSSALIRERLREKRFIGRSLGALLTDQSFVAGLGNYLRCEILHCAGQHPVRRPRDLPDDELKQLAQQILALPRQSYHSGGVTNDLQRAARLMDQAGSFEAARFHVFRRAGLPCYRCGTAIVQIRQGGQGCYLCPTCQPQY